MKTPDLGSALTEARSAVARWSELREEERRAYENYVGLEGGSQEELRSRWLACEDAAGHAKTLVDEAISWVGTLLEVEAATLDRRALKALVAISEEETPASRDLMKAHGVFQDLRQERNQYFVELGGYGRRGDPNSLIRDAESNPCATNFEIEAWLERHRVVQARIERDQQACRVAYDAVMAALRSGAVNDPRFATVIAGIESARAAKLRVSQVIGELLAPIREEPPYSGQPESWLLDPENVFSKER